MKKKIKKKMHKILNIVVIFAMFLIVPQAFSETLEEKIIRIKANLQQTTEQQQQLEEKINQVEAEFV